MDLNTLWFILVAVLWIGFFVLEGFDFGVGMLLPFLGKGDTQRRVILNTIGPHWDGNEVWLLTAGGAMFAAFPEWYATMFSGFYLALFLLLVALIVRGIALEFRSKNDSPRWRNNWDWAVFGGSLVAALLLGVAWANLVRGLPIDQAKNYVGGFWYLLNPYSLVGGVTAVVCFALYGAVFLALKTTDDVLEAAERAAMRLWLPAVLLLALFGVFTYFQTDLLDRLGINPGIVPLTSVVALLVSGWFIRRGQMGWSFLLIALSIVSTMVTAFMILFPRVMISTLDPAWSLTIYNASSSPYTLRVMTIVALIFVPVVLIYQGWSYWVFRSRVASKEEALTY